MPDRRAERLAALRALLAAEGLGALVVAQAANIRYLTGFSGSSALLLVTDGASVLVTDSRYETQAADEAGSAARVVIAAAGLVEALLALIPEAGARDPIGFEAHVLTVREAARLTDGTVPGRFRPAGELVERLRVVKAPEEIALLRAAAAAAGAALAQAVAEIRVGLSELEVAALLEAALRRAGSVAHPFPTIVASGPRAALPHARTSERRVAAGEFLLLDYGAEVGGYCADVTRTFVVGGAPDARQREVYGVVHDAQGAAMALMRAGMTGRAADALARDRIAAAGYGAAFGHSLGHGLGLEVHEAPRVSKASEEPLPAGAVVTVEPGVYLPGWGGVRIEDDVVLGEGAAALLTDIPRELVVLG